MEGKHLQTHFVPQKSESALKELRVIRVKADISWRLSHRNVAWNVFTSYYTLISITDMTSHLSMSWPSWPSVSETGSEGGAAAGSSSDPEDVRDGELIMRLLKVIPYSHLTPTEASQTLEWYLSHFPGGHSHMFAVSGFTAICRFTQRHWHHSHKHSLQVTVRLMPDDPPSVSEESSKPRTEEESNFSLKITVINKVESNSNITSGCSFPFQILTWC